MKTTIIFSLAFLFTSLLTAGPAETKTTAFEMEEEAYVDDIPFNTAEIVQQMSFILPEEDYADDIPFSTEKMVAQYAEEMDEEMIANDIPFNTEMIVMGYALEMTEESNVNDIPFDTKCVAQQIKKNAPICKCLVNGNDSSNNENETVISNEIQFSDLYIFVNFFVGSGLGSM